MLQLLWQSLSEPVMSQALPHDNRRSHERFKFIKPMRVLVAKRTVKGFTVDIGEGGGSFIVDTMLHKGSVTVEIPDVQLTLEGQILGYQPTSDAGLYRHHMQFKTPLRTAVLEQILT